MELVIEEVVVMTYVLYIWASTSWECGLRRGMQGAYFDQNCWNKELDFGAAGIVVY